MACRLLCLPLALSTRRILEPVMARTWAMPLESRRITPICRNNNEKEGYRKYHSNAVTTEEKHHYILLSGREVKETSKLRQHIFPPSPEMEEWHRPFAYKPRRGI